MIKVRTWLPLPITCKMVCTSEEAADYIDDIVEKFEERVNRQLREYNALVDEKNKTLSYGSKLYHKEEISLEVDDIMKAITLIDMDPAFLKDRKRPRQ